MGDRVEVMHRAVVSMGRREGDGWAKGEITLLIRRLEKKV